MARLKSKAIEKLPEEKKEKMQKTLDKMVENRQEDNRVLRDIIKQKLDYALAEKQKGIDAIERQLKQIQENRETLLKIDGIILVLTQLLEPEPKEEPTKE